jgi:ABC-type branched-subunit amino acid transport system ATPase component
MQKLDTMIARLRFLLADVGAKEKQVATLRRQLREQFDRVVTYSLYGDAELDRSLALMSDVEQRLQQAETDSRHLQRIRERAERELESLLLTKGVEEAKARLAALHMRKAEIERALTQATAPGAACIDLESAASLRQADQALDSEIRRLQHEINEASERAARSLETQRR